ncbi:MAG: hypothetical protein AMXMBFR76_07430 [Pseudomonadota bacterium]|jgi:electron transport complex protein RnfG
MAAPETTERPDPAAFRAGLALGGAALVVFALVLATVHWTEPRMAQNRARDALALVREIAGAEADPPGALRPLRLPPAGELHQNTAFTAYQLLIDGRVASVILPAVAPDGYSGRIELLVGIDDQGRVTRVRVTRHHETVGLGDRIDRARSAWITQFDGRSLTDPAQERWNVRKDGGDFDQITGATLTPRAVIHAVAAALQYAARHREPLFDPAGQAAP